MTRSSDPGPRHHLPGGRVGAWAAATLIGLIGLAMVGTALVGDLTSGPRWTAIGVGGFLLAVAWLLVSAGGVRAGSGWTTATVDGQPGWVLPIRGSAALATVLSVLGLGLAGLAVDGAVTGRTGVAVMAGAVALFLLMLAAEFWRILLRRPELRLGVDRIELRGPGIDAELAWEDVGVVDYRDLGTRWAAVHVSAATPAPSYRHRLRRLVLPLDRAPEPPGIAVRVGQVPDAPGLLKVLRALHAAGRDGRVAMITRGHPEASGH